MIRRVFTIASALSLVACVAIVALWVRADAVLEDFEYARFLPDISGQHAFARDGIFFRDGGVNYAHSLMLRNPIFHDSLPVGLQHRRDDWVNTAYYASIIRPERGIAGFAAGWVRHRNTATDFRGHGVRIPLWFLLLASALLPAHYVLTKLRRRRRMRGGLCRSCGYDLRASNGRCPECGTAIPAKMTR